MNTGMRYGEVALGVESALPGITGPARRRSRTRRFINWLAAALMRWT